MKGADTRPLTEPMLTIRPLFFLSMGKNARVTVI